MVAASSYHMHICRAASSSSATALRGRGAVNGGSHEEFTIGADNSGEHGACGNDRGPHWPIAS
jgi:hypothetical protein